MEILFGLFLFIFGLWILWILITLPAIIAEKRGIRGGDLSTIRGLSWLGLLLPFVWFIALIFALLWKPEKTNTDG